MTQTKVRESKPRADDAEGITLPDSSGTPPRLSRTRRVARCVRRLSLRLALAAALAFGAVSGWAAFQYDLPLDAAASGVARNLGLWMIQTAIRVHDPYPAVEAALGPHDLEPIDVQAFSRLESHFPHEDGARRLQVSGGWVTLTSLDNAEIVRSRYPFRYQPHGEPRLEELREKYNLDDVVAGAESEFEVMVRLRNWSRSQFRRCDYQPICTDFDALAILDRNLRNTADAPFDPAKHIDPCKFFPALYSQVLLSFGYVSRIVSITHGMVEVWSNQYRKWILMDAELNLHYERDGIPLNMMEMHDANFDPGADEIEIIYGEQWSGDVSTTLAYLKVEKLSIENMVEYHRDYITIVDMRNDWMTNHYFRGHPARSKASSLTFSDPRCPSTTGINDWLKPRTSDVNDMYWTLNQVEIRCQRPKSTDTLQLVFDTVTPNFAYFDVLIDGTISTTTDDATFQWALHPGRNHIEVRPINEFGVRGIPSRVTLDVRRSAAVGQ